MTQKAVVKKLLSGGVAEIEVQRQSACGHDCSKCGGCGTPTERITAQAVNRAHAQVGEVVTIEGDNKQVFGAAAIVYTVPLVLFFVMYALLRMIGGAEGMAIGGGILGFTLGIAGAVAYNHRVRRMGMIPFVIIKRS
ncbi:MAG: hypothetical protein EOM63_03210 [Clostridia bacterium]|nr:hypothetical protein [Clostridia bacterium]